MEAVKSCCTGKFTHELDGMAVGQFKDMDTAGYIRTHYTQYDGDASFLAGPTPATKALMTQVEKLLHDEINAGGLLDVDAKTPSSIIAFPAAYIDKSLEKIVGLQTDAPLRRAIKPYGGARVVEAALKSYNRVMDPAVMEVFSKYRKTHNDGVFDAYTEEMKLARKSGILSGLPDGYGRGRIIGDYRRVALFGVDELVASKKHDLNVALSHVTMNETIIRLREEVQEQIRALEDLKTMAKLYGFDISKPATNAAEAIQWLYFGYLAAVREQDGAAMSLGRIDAFLDTFIEKDIKEGKITESEAQELLDHFVIKLRLVRHLRTPEYNNLFAGDPTWVTIVVGGMCCGEDGVRKSMVTKTSYRLLHTLVNLGPAPEPNLTVLWSKALPESFKIFCTGTSIDTSSIQYENDDLMNPIFGADYSIACCVSAMRTGKDMQFFGARANLPKLLLYVINGGRDEVLGLQVGPKFPAVKGDENTPLDHDEIKANLLHAMEWLTALYANTMNCIHFMHDKYNYEKIEMALHDTNVHRFLAFGVSGLSVVADSLSAMKYGKVFPIRNADGLAVDFKVEGEFPKYGNDDARVDEISRWLVTNFNGLLQKQHAYRRATPSLSVLTITSNVVYGKVTGSTPDGRKKGEPFAPGANPMHGRELSGALASLNSVAQLPYSSCMDGISNTFSIVPTALGKDDLTRKANLAGLLDGYFANKGFHINVNALNRDTLLDAVAHPENYPNLTIRVSGYAVNFIKLTPAQQREVIARTFHDTMA